MTNDVNPLQSWQRAHAFVRFVARSPPPPQPPHIVLNPTFGTSISDFDSSAATNVEEMTPETTPRSWWESGGPNKDVYEGFDASVEKLRDVLENDEQGFDGVMGFSQVGNSPSALRVTRWALH